MTIAAVGGILSAAGSVYMHGIRKISFWLILAAILILPTGCEGAKLFEGYVIPAGAFSDSEIVIKDSTAPVQGIKDAIVIADLFTSRPREWRGCPNANEEGYFFTGASCAPLPGRSYFSVQAEKGGYESIERLYYTGKRESKVIIFLNKSHTPVLRKIGVKAPKTDTNREEE